jgi:hypothetical protein
MQLVATFTASSPNPGRLIVYADGRYKMDDGTDLHPGFIMALDRQGMLDWRDSSDREALTILARSAGHDSGGVL